MKFLLLPLLILVTQPATAKNRAFSLFGNSRYDKAEEWQPYLFESACMKAQGWEVESVVSEETEGFDERLGAVIDEKNVSALQADEPGKVAGEIKDLNKAGKFDAAAQVREKFGADVTNKIKHAIAKATLDLRSGDQFLFQIRGHGASNCDYKHNPDLTKGAKDYEHCNHTFGVMVDGTEVAISSADLIAALKPLKKRGVKVAVDMLSCFGGAAMKDFAAEGICAHTYSTPDAPTSGCGMPPRKEAASNTNALSAYSSCRKLDDKAFGELSTKLSPNPDVVACSQMGRETLKSISLPEKPSFSQQFDAFRRQDATLNQAVGTDGPYWIIGNLGLMGLSGIGAGYGTNPYQTNLEECTSKDDYFGQLAGHLQDISSKLLGKDCTLKGEVDQFIKKNEGDLSDYFAAFKNVNSIIGKVRGIIKDKIPEKVQAEILDFKKKELAQFTANKRKEFGALLAEDPMSAIQDCIQVKEFPCYEKFSAAMGAEAADAIYKDVEKVLKDEAPEARKNLQTAYTSKVLKMERGLYDQLKNSPAYAKCVNGHQALKEAKKDCEAFQLP